MASGLDCCVQAVQTGHGRVSASCQQPLWHRRAAPLSQLIRLLGAASEAK